MALCLLALDCRCCIHGASAPRQQWGRGYAPTPIKSSAKRGGKAAPAKRHERAKQVRAGQDRRFQSIADRFRKELIEWYTPRSRGPAATTKSKERFN
jgi:hypothetical protein